MSKELDLEVSNAIIEIASDEMTPLDDISLALVGGGELAIAI